MSVMSHVRPLLSLCLESDTCGQCPSGHMSQLSQYAILTSDMCHIVSYLSKSTKNEHFCSAFSENIKYIL